MTNSAHGTFDVHLTPQPPDATAADTTIGRMIIAKQFHGDLTATSTGQMLAAGTSIADSAGYVALEHVNGTLDGHTGTFVLQHNGTMTRGAPQLTITVVPDSGTGQLVGLTGTLTIAVTDSIHTYDFAYTLAETR